MNKPSVFLLVSRLAAMALLLSAGDSIAAPTQAQQQAIRSSCQSDYKTYCASVPTGGSEALQCLEQNVAKLSSACRGAVKAATGGGGSSTASGESSSSSGGSSSSSTSSSSTTAPSAGTAAAGAAESGGKPVIIVLNPGQEIALMRQACGADYRDHCNGVRVRGGAALRCLVSHASSLSKWCKGELGRLGQKFQ